MLISKEHRKSILETLFKDGVMVAAKDFNAKSHPEFPDSTISNLEVIKLMQSLTSQGYVHTQFSWQYYYYSLTTEGIDFIREFLHLPNEVVPATLMKKAGTERRPDDFDRRGPRRDRDREDRDYRRKEGVSGDFKPEFRGGLGRGRND